MSPQLERHVRSDGHIEGIPDRASPGLPVTSSYRADLELLAGANLHPIQQSDLRTCRQSIIDGLEPCIPLLRPGYAWRTALRVSEMNPISHIGTVHAITIDGDKRSVQVTVAEHDKAFIFETEFGAKAYQDLSQRVGTWNPTFVPRYLQGFPFTTFHLAPRVGDATLELKLGFDRSLNGWNLALCSFEIHTNLRSALGYESYCANLTGSGNVRSATYIDGKLERTDGLLAEIDLRYVDGQLKRLLCAADELRHFMIQNELESRLAS